MADAPGSRRIRRRPAQARTGYGFVRLPAPPSVACMWAPPQESAAWSVDFSLLA